MNSFLKRDNDQVMYYCYVEQDTLCIVHRNIGRAGRKKARVTRDRIFISLRVTCWMLS